MGDLAYREQASERSCLASDHQAGEDTFADPPVRRYYKSPQQPHYLSASLRPHPQVSLTIPFAGSCLVLMGKWTLNQQLNAQGA